MIIAFEGLPGVGKTTAAGLVAKRLDALALQETTGDHPFLSQVYDDANRDDLTVELSFLLVHANPYRRLDRSRLVLCDFSPAKDELFAEDMLMGDDLELFEGIYERVYRGHELPDLAVYMRAEPEFCLERVRRRMELEPKRGFEAGMTLRRLERMRDRYEAALDRLGRDSIVYDVPRGAASPDQVADELAELLRPRVDSVVV